MCWDNLFFSVHWSGVKDTAIKAAKINNAVSWAVNLKKTLKHHHMPHSSAHSLYPHMSLFWNGKSSGLRHACRYSAADDLLSCMLIYEFCQKAAKIRDTSENSKTLFIIHYSIMSPRLKVRGGGNNNWLIKLKWWKGLGIENLRNTM